MTRQQTTAHTETDDSATEPTLVAFPDDAKTILREAFGEDPRLTDLTAYENADGHQLLTESGTNWVRIRSTADGLLAEQVEADSIDEDDLDELSRTEPAEQPGLSVSESELRRRGD